MMQRNASLAFGLAAIVAVLSGNAAQAEVQYPWCAQYRSAFGATNCGFVTYRQCLDTISGVGGICTPNPAYHPPARPKRDRSR